MRESLKYDDISASEFTDVIGVFELRYAFFHPLPIRLVHTGPPIRPHLRCAVVRLQSRGLPEIILAAGIPRPDTASAGLGL